VCIAANLKPIPHKLSKTGTAEPDADAVEPDANAAADPDPVDEQRGCAAPGREAALDELVIVNEIATVKHSSIGVAEFALQSESAYNA
jgi:hypothetical protein